MKKLSRKEFIQKTGLGVMLAPTLLNGVLVRGNSRELMEFKRLGSMPNFNCILSPEQMGGPFYLDPKFERSDIKENLQGLPMKINVKVLGVKNCEPMPDAVVNIWHCDITGTYSEFGKVNGNPNDASDKTWLKGYQKTDVRGDCSFDTIFPGWYPGRVTHIHFDVHLDFTAGGPIDQNPNPSSFAISQMYFPDELLTKVYTNVPEYQSKGDNPTKLMDDLVLGGDMQEARDLMLDVDESDFPNSLTANFVIGIDKEGIPTNINTIEAKKHFNLKQNFPNPVSQYTNVEFYLEEPGFVTFSVYTIDGELIHQTINKKYPQGNNVMTLRRHIELNHLSSGTYIYKMAVQNTKGRYHQSKSMILK